MSYNKPNNFYYLSNIIDIFGDNVTFMVVNQYGDSDKMKLRTII